MHRRDMLRGIGLTALLTTQSFADVATRPIGKSKLPDELWRWDAADLAAAIRKKHISSREVVMSCLGRLESVNSKINAVVDFSADEALAAADDADRALRSHAAPDVLHGVPVTSKIMTDQRGHATSYGAVALKNSIAREDSTSVNNLRSAGAVMLGRTNSSTFGTRWFTDNDLYGRTLNPWNASVTPGGSSGGAAASVAVGITPLAQCTDGMGSVRIPAYACGVTGIRPSFGRVAGINPSAAARPRGISTELIDVDGLIARRVSDLRLGLSVTARGDIRDPWWVPVRSFPKTRGPIRVALFDHADGITVDPAVASGLTRAADALTQAGYSVESVIPPRYAEITPLLFSMVFNENREHRAAQVQQYGDERSKKAMAAFSAMTPPLDLPGFSNALGRREQILVEWKKFLRTYPLIVMSPCWARPFAQDFDMQGQEQFAAMVNSLGPTFCASLLGLPSVAVPTGVIDGLPTGVEIVGDQFREDMCLDAGEIVEAAIVMPTPIDPHA